MHDFSVAATPSGQATVVVVTGDVDLATADRLREAGLAHIRPGAELSLDCSGVGFLDSAGLRVLLELDRTARTQGGVLILAAPSEPVTRTMELAGVAEVFTVRSAPVA